MHNPKPETTKNTQQKLSCEASGGLWVLVKPRFRVQGKPSYGRSDFPKSLNPKPETLNPQVLTQANLLISRKVFGRIPASTEALYGVGFRL